MRTKRFRLTNYETRGFIILEQRICLIWFKLVGDDGDYISFRNVVEAEEYLSKDKKFGEVFEISYKKVLE